MLKVDVAIIGAGPGGGMAACRLAKTGLRVMILEQYALPRHKTCGGGIPVGAKKLFDWDLQPLIENEVTAFKFQYDYALEKVLPSPTPITMMVSRKRFDLALIEHALQVGRGQVTLRDNFALESVEETEQGVTVYGARGEAVQADFVVGADGAFSKVARSLGLNRKPHYGAAIEAELEVDPDVFEAEKETATINLFCVRNGYGWIFPKDGYLSCGVGSWRSRAKLPQAMDEFLQRTFRPGVVRSVKSWGHPIPLYAGQRQIASRRVCLVGDAASFVDPIMGEGIRFALKSGRLAGKVIAALASGSPARLLGEGLAPEGEFDCRVYQTLAHAQIGHGLEELLRLVAPMVFRAPELYYRTFVSNGGSYRSLPMILSNEMRRMNAAQTIDPAQI